MDGHKWLFDLLFSMIAIKIDSVLISFEDEVVEDV